MQTNETSAIDNIRAHIEANRSKGRATFTISGISALLAEYDQLVTLSGMAEPVVYGRNLLIEVIGDVCTFRDMEPEEDESWESWYFAAFDMLTDRIKETFERNRSEAFVTPPTSDLREENQRLRKVLQEITQPSVDNSVSYARDLAFKALYPEGR